MNSIVSRETSTFIHCDIWIKLEIMMMKPHQKFCHVIVVFMSICRALTAAIWFGHLLTFCQTYWSSARFGVVTTSNGLFRMYPSTGLCVKYVWYDSITGLLVWNWALLTFRLSVNWTVVGSERNKFVERKPFTTALLPTNFENIVNFLLFLSKQQNEKKNYTNKHREIKKKWMHRRIVTVLLLNSKLNDFFCFPLFFSQIDIIVVCLLFYWSYQECSLLLSLLKFFYRCRKNTKAIRLNFTLAAKRENWKNK